MAALAKEILFDGEIPGASAPRGAERRGGTRIRTVYCIGRITNAADGGLCFVHNISNGGARIETVLELAVGETVKLGLSDATWLRGRVAWRAGNACGIRFLAPIDCCALLRTLADDRWSGRSRPPRLSLHRGAMLEAGGHTQPATVRDISQKGMKIRHLGTLTPGERVRVRIDGGIEAEGVVRWSQGGSSGVELTAAFTVAELGSATSFSGAWCI